MAGLAVGAYRHARRDGAPVAGIHAAIDQTLARYYGDDSFATGIVARSVTGPGRLECSCAGHPRPLLLRGGKVVAELGCDGALPFGLGGDTPELGVGELEPDDAVLYTGGVVEARIADGELSGLERPAGLLERGLPAASRPGNCCAGWSGPCWSTRLAACAMTPRCWCNGPAAERGLAALTCGLAAA